MTNFADGPAGDVFDPPADRQRGEHDGQVGLDGVPGPVVDRPGLQVAFGHPEWPLLRLDPEGLALSTADGSETVRLMEG